MKKASLLCCVFTLLFILSSCKKGEDDPLISFRSRKARVEGHWTLQTGNLDVSQIDSSGATSAINYKIAGSKFNYTDHSTGGKEEGQFNLTLDFTKDGKMTITQQIGPTSLKADGSWDFLGKVGETKNKEKINLRINTINHASYFIDTFNKMQMNFTYSIKELRNKYMVLYCEKEVLEVSSGGTLIVSAEYSFTQ